MTKKDEAQKTLQDYFNSPSKLPSFHHPKRSVINAAESNISTFFEFLKDFSLTAHNDADRVSIFNWFMRNDITKSTMTSVLGTYETHMKNNPKNGNYPDHIQNGEKILNSFFKNAYAIYSAIGEEHKSEASYIFNNTLKKIHLTSLYKKNYQLEYPELSTPKDTLTRKEIALDPK